MALIEGPRFVSELSVAMPTHITVPAGRFRGQALFQCDAVCYEYFLCFGRHQEFDKAFGCSGLRGARHQRGGVRDITLEISRQRPKKFHARRSHDERYRTRREVVSFAFQHVLKMSLGAVRTILGLSASAIPSRSRTAAKACPDLTLLKTIRSAPSKVLLNFSMVDMSYAGLSARFPRPTPMRPTIGLSPARTFPEPVSSSTKSGGTTTTPRARWQRPAPYAHDRCSQRPLPPASRHQRRRGPERDSTGEHPGPGAAAATEGAGNGPDHREQRCPSVRFRDLPDRERGLASHRPSCGRRSGRPRRRRRRSSRASRGAMRAFPKPE